jgi:hypothetical protein
MWRIPGSEPGERVGMRRFLNVRWIIVVALVPLALLGLYVLVIQIHGLTRYDPVYFTRKYVEMYDNPGSVARTLEGALQANDKVLLAELQGRRRMATFYTSPDMIFVMLWERMDRFFTYLYFDMQTYERHVYHFEEINGRYVAMEPDPYYYFHSGRWVLVFAPLSITWWAIEIVVILVVVLYRISARLRERIYGD